MSEYQCHEFVTIDRLLTCEEMAQLRSRSPYTTITPTSFINEYNWDALRQFMLRHAKHGASVRRLVEAGLWQK